MRLVFEYSLVAVFLYCSLIILLYVFQRSLMYHPQSHMVSPAATGLENIDIIELKNDSGINLVSWYRPAQSSKPTILFLHGNAGNITNRAFKAKIFIEEGYGFLLAGYRGYGGNKGNPSEKGLYNDALTSFNFLQDQGISSNNIILYGESLGAAIAVDLAFKMAKKRPIRSLILESPFSSMVDAAQNHYPYIPVKFLLKDKYDSYSKISNINTPLFIFHGGKDTTVRINLGKKLFNGALDPKFAYWEDNAGHNDLFEFSVEEKIMDFIERH